MNGRPAHPDQLSLLEHRLRWQDLSHDTRGQVLSLLADLFLQRLSSASSTSSNTESSDVTRED
jgi:phosphatidylserine/phosphatidylglycerophosphate/cardiolipin synthase-like enzyme